MYSRKIVKQGGIGYVASFVYKLESEFIATYTTYLSSPHS